MHRATVNAGAQVGVNNIVNSCALIEHDATVGDHCHISTGAILNGGVHVAEGSFFGSNAVTRQAITIGSGCIIGAGAIVLSNVPDGTVFTGRRPNE
jgi:acetyltransferase-like isoleucine patch superfamily enzyme